MLKLRISALVLSAAFAGILAGADAPPITKTFDQQVGMVEREVVSLAEAVPADKYDFAPKAGEFKGVRTFAQQVSHIASVNYAVAASILGEKNPIDMGTSENGPATLKTKDEIVKFLKDSFAYTHKAMASVNADNLNEMITSAFGEGKVPRLSMVTVPVWHTFDHYGQMVVYARLNGIVPPASR